jgi:DNA-binding CsgD family transcriptional regulator
VKQETRMQTVIALRPEIVPIAEHHLLDVYRYATRNGAIDEVDRVATDLGMDVAEVNAAVEQLLEGRLLRVDQGRGLVPVDPEVATALLVSPMEREIYQRRERIAQIRQRTDAFRRDYADTGRPAAVERVAGEAEVNGLLRVAADACRDEVLVLRSGAFDSDELDDFLSVCGGLVDRGVVVRMVCQHRDRGDFASRVKIRKLTDSGAVVRTVSHLPRTAVVFDRTSAVLMGGHPAQAVASWVRHDEVVAFLLDVFDHLWDVATALEGADTGYAEVADDLLQTVASLMAKGFTDEVVARKLGMSVRTCRRHIAALMRDLDAVSRFQAGVRAAHRALVS